MKIKFDNNSVSGVNRKYRGFVLDIPGQSSRTVDVPPQYVSDAVAYLKYRHPAVICTPLVAERASEAAPAAAPQGDIAADRSLVAPIVAPEPSEPAAIEVDGSNAKATAEIADTATETAKETTGKKGKAVDTKGKTTKAVKGTEKKSTQKIGGKK